MYDEIVGIIHLTCDEIEVLKELLSHRLGATMSIGEYNTVKDLLNRLEDV